MRTSSRSSTVRPSLGARREVRLQQRRLRGPGHHRREVERRTVPPARGRAGVSPAVMPTPSSCAPTSFRERQPWVTSGPTVHARTSCIFRCSAQATAGSTRRLPTSAFWAALFDGRIVSTNAVAEMVRPRSQAGGGTPLRPWLPAGREDRPREARGLRRRSLLLEYARPDRRITATVISNTAEGAWPLVEMLDERLSG